MTQRFYHSVFYALIGSSLSLANVSEPDFREGACVKRIHNLIAERVGNRPWLIFRKRLLERRKQLEQAVLVRLMSTKRDIFNLSEDEQRILVASAIEEVMALPAASHRLPKLKAFSYFLGAIGLQAGLTTAFILTLDKTSAAIAAATTSSVLTVVTTNLAAVVYERWSSTLKRRAYQNGHPANPREIEFEQIASTARMMLSEWGDRGRSVEQNARGTVILPTCTACVTAAAAGYADWLELSARRFAYMLTALERNYPEIGPTGSEITAAVRETFAADFITNENWQDFILRVKVFLSGKKGSALTDAEWGRYERTLIVWCRPR